MSSVSKLQHVRTKLTKLQDRLLKDESAMLYLIRLFGPTDEALKNSGYTLNGGIPTSYLEVKECTEELQQVIMLLRQCNQ